MLSFYLYKELFSINHLLAYSTASLISHHKIQVPTLFRSFGHTHFLSASYFSAASCPVDNVDVSEVSTTDVKSADEKKSYTVSYLMNTFGFTQERAVSISAKINFKDPGKPNSVLALLERYGFSPTQIADVVRRCPDFLVMKENIIVPKFEFFLSVGMSKGALATFISTDPRFLSRSLERFIIPNYNSLKRILLTKEKVVYAISQTPSIFYQDAEKCFGPNVKVLRELNVPEPCIRYLMMYYPEVLHRGGNKSFEESVSKVLGMGFDPLKMTFVLALRAVSAPNKVTFDRCYETYRSWGWSEEDIYTAFRKHPNCMIMSQNKINKVMDFLVKQIGLDTKFIIQNPIVICFSLEKRIIPRLSVIQALSSRGLLRKQPKLRSLLSRTEKQFLDRFVVSYEKKVPELYSLYKGKIGSSNPSMKE